MSYVIGLGIAFLFGLIVGHGITAWELRDLDDDAS